MNRLLPAVGDEILLNVPHTELVDGDGPGCFDLLLKRRELVRATAGLPLTLIATGADEEVVTAEALDLSGGGLLIGGLPHRSID